MTAIHTCSDEEAAYTDAATLVTGLLSLALPGGTTVREFLPRLGALPLDCGRRRRRDGGASPVRAVAVPELDPADTTERRSHGRRQRKVLERALQRGPAEDMPLRFLLRQQRVPLSIYTTPNV